MKLSEDHKLVLEEIVNLEGDCLKKERCERCPFRMSCLPEFLTSPNLPPTKNQRFEMALDTITRDIIMKDEEPQKPLWENKKS